MKKSYNWYEFYSYKEWTKTVSTQNTNELQLDSFRMLPTERFFGWEYDYIIIFVATYLFLINEKVTENSPHIFTSKNKALLLSRLEVIQNIII